MLRKNFHGWRQRRQESALKRLQETLTLDEREIKRLENKKRTPRDSAELDRRTTRVARARLEIASLEGKLACTQGRGWLEREKAAARRARECAQTQTQTQTLTSPTS